MRKGGSNYHFLGALEVPMRNLLKEPRQRMNGSYDLIEIQSGMLFLDLRVQYFNE